jgi:hypothetical protein
MRMRWVARLLVPGAMGLLCGCHWLATPRFDTPMPVATDLPIAERVIPAPDISDVPENTAPPVPNNYFQLTADTCRDLAYKNSSLANLIESSVVVRRGPFQHLGGQDCEDLVRLTTAGQLSKEARNRSAGAALKLYYQLLELELKSDVLASSLVELDSLVKTVDTLRDKGFKVPEGSYELKKQRIELQADQAKLRSGLVKLNGELKNLLAIDPSVPGFLLPADAVKVAPDPLDADIAVQVGLANRADLQLLRTLQGTTTDRTVGAVRRVLMGATPILGAVMPVQAEKPALVPFVRSMAKAEACQLKSQLQSVVADREREATKDIRNAVDEWITARDLVAIGRSKFQLAKEQVTDLEKRDKLGQAVEVELRKARLEAYKLEADLVSEIARWKLADVKAREELGLLCGS